jgi:uncharacterized protein (TIGR03000 family)
MRKKRTAALAAVVLSLATLFLATTDAHAQRGRGGYGYRYGGGYYHGGYYRPYGYYGYGYRGFYPGIGIGIGIGGFYAPYYGSYAYPIAPGYAYNPYPATVIVNGSPQAPQLNQAPGAAQPAEKPAPDGAGHLQLIVPENAEVFIDGSKISQSGAMREIVTPKLQPGTRYTYRISVRYADASGKVVDETRAIRFQADDWFTIDFTRPAPPQGTAPPPAPLQLQQTPSLSK